MVTLKINGRNYEIDADPQMPLLWALRDLLQLTGTKFGCAQGLCGACTIHINGVAARACMTSVAAAVSTEITTIEGLAMNGSHPLQRAWVEHKVPQCGYCQPGQIMAAAALLKTNPKPTDEQIKSAMSGNLCRCGTYPRIEAAIKSVIGVQTFDPNPSEKSSVGGAA